MRRPAVTVVMPFAGDSAAARHALHALLDLRTRDGDELILVDNSGTVAHAQAGVTIVGATVEASPAHARNAGAERASTDWILFLDADTRAPHELLDAYFGEPVDAGVGALVGEVVAAPDAATVTARYGAARSFLSQRAHLAHPYLPRAAAANLMVRRAAFEQVGGFYEGLRAAEDTDFSWRLQQAGWRLDLRPGASVEHSYRASLGELRRQWRGYAAGRAWLARRYEGFEPEPAVRRAAGRLRRRPARDGPRNGLPRANRTLDRVGPLERSTYFALDALLAAEEIRGLALSNRPGRETLRPQAQVVLVTDRFPAHGDPLVEFALSLERARVEAVARPEHLATGAARELTVDYSEDDGIAERIGALLHLAVRHPLRCWRDLWAREPGSPTLRTLAPAATRLGRDQGARVHPLGANDIDTTARRLAALAGLQIDRP